MKTRTLKDGTEVQELDKRVELSILTKCPRKWKIIDMEWDKELDIIKELKTEEFLDFIKADFGLSNMVKLAMSHPKLAVRQLFNLVKSKQ